MGIALEYVVTRRGYYNNYEEVHCFHNQGAIVIIPGKIMDASKARRIC